MNEVAIIMGSDSDWNIMKDAKEIIQSFGVGFETMVLSAHRTPEDMIKFAKEAKTKYKVIIAGAGGAAHLPGMVASCTTLPVIGVPIKLNALDGMDSLLSIVQMPKGVPVATVAINNARNAGLLALSMLSIYDTGLSEQLDAYRHDMAAESRKKSLNLN